MKLVLKKSFAWLLLFLPLVVLFSFTRPAAAQTDPETTPVNGYPPPATPIQPEEAYPNQLPPPTGNPVNGAYIAPTANDVEATNPPAVIGDTVPEVTADATPPISQSSLVRNRAILWAGFLITLILFFLAVYGAMVMYIRPRN